MFGRLDMGFANVRAGTRAGTRTRTAAEPFTPKPASQAASHAAPWARVPLEEQAAESMLFGGALALAQSRGTCGSQSKL